MRIDSHQHFWHYDSAEYDWIDESMAQLKRDFLPAQLEGLLEANRVDGCVAVQARQTEAETEFLLALSDDHDFIKGVVGWVDLCSPDVSDRLNHFSSHEKLCGIRHIVQAEADDNFMLRHDFQRGIEVLAKFDLAYDILIFPKHLSAAYELAATFPNHRFVIDHVAKPGIKDGRIDSWREGIERVAQLPNVHCKASGMVTEADWSEWTADDFTPYLDVVFSSFGVERTMIGSDWPVCLLGGDYRQVTEIVTNYIATFSIEDRQKILGSNAVDFYRLN